VAAGSLIATTSTAPGVHAGFNSSNLNATIALINNSATDGSAYINFCLTSSGNSTNNFFWQLIGNTNTTSGGYFALRYTNSVGEIFRVDCTTANRTFLIGATATPASTAYKLYVNGNQGINGTLTVNGTGTSNIPTINSVTVTTGTLNTSALNVTGLLSLASIATSVVKAFDIVHPLKPGYRLRHRCNESPEPRLNYEFTLTCKTGLNTFDMPDYFEAMNKDVRVYCSAARSFGQAWGETQGNLLHVTCSQDGDYYVMVVGTRNDKDAQEEMDTYGVEYPEPSSTSN
jgi:hypothetical protein